MQPPCEMSVAWRGCSYHPIRQQSIHRVRDDVDWTGYIAKDP
jgi:hypothetical protein